MTCDNTAHFLSSFYFNFSTLPQQTGDCYFCKTLILSPFSHKAPSNLTHKVAFPYSSARPPKPNSLCNRSGASSLPLPGRLPASPHPHSLPKTGSLEGAESGGSSRTVSYLGKTCLGMDRTLRTVCLGCKVHDKTCFFAVQSASWSPKTELPSILIVFKVILFPCTTP